MVTWGVCITARVSARVFEWIRRKVVVVEREATFIERLPSTFISFIIYERYHLSGLCCWPWKKCENGMTLTFCD
jgi:hypothetical protein